MGNPDYTPSISRTLASGQRAADTLERLGADLACAFRCRHDRFRQTHFLAGDNVTPDP
jgi:hypothetical protein